uniref:Nuclear pore complex protein Nup98-Nup96 n=1 Tax=Anthurium amnicola TaxID=1678845 RepID=A0A1D1Z1U3_9ARAE
MAAGAVVHEMSPQLQKDPQNVGSQAFLPVLRPPDYYTQPSIGVLAAREGADGGYCSRVPDFVVGRDGYGKVKFFGETDVRWLDLGKIVKFERHSIAVYEDESVKPPAGRGLNKAAQVSLMLHLGSTALQGAELEGLVRKLRCITERQGAHFVSFDPSTHEWRFVVQHFSRFGLVEDDEEDDVVMDDAVIRADEKVEEPQVSPASVGLSHSLPAHLGLDPVKMQEMRTLMFSADEECVDFEAPLPFEKGYHGKDYLRSESPSSSARSSIHRPPLLGSAPKMGRKTSPMRKAPQGLLEYDATNSDLQLSGNILVTRRSRGFPVRTMKAEGFKLDMNHVTPLSGSYSANVVDAALFMGRSFRVGWGPNGILVHTGTRVGKPGNELSSIINLEKVALDRTVRDENDKVKEELIDLRFLSPLNLHKSLDHESTDVELGSCRIQTQKVLADRFSLPEICRRFIGILERQLDVPGLSTSSRVILMHQVTVWELIRVLFSDRVGGGNPHPLVDDEGEDMALDKKDLSSDVDPEASQLVRRAEFSYWLQESVCHRVQEEVSCLSESSNLEHILLLLTGRQLDMAVELAASTGDVRLAILLSQAGGSMVNRSDVARQLDIWKINGLDFGFIENERLKLYDLLSGNVQSAFHDLSIDWKRYLGLVMWYQLPPDTSLPVIIHNYEQLVNEGRAPYPVPVYIDEGPLEEAMDWSAGDRFDIAYYLMLLHANGEKLFGDLKTMFSAFASTHDALDYHMIWHYKAILEAIGTFNSNDLHLLDMSLISQLLCLGLCHWAIYVVLHMDHCKEFPHLQTNLIREILFQYCETWSTQSVQRQFIEDLGIPSEWMHEAMAIYFEYHGDPPKALDHFLNCSNWRKSHTIFMTSVAHSLFLSSKHSEIWNIAGTMEMHKSEIADWDLGAGIFIDFYTIRSSLQANTIGDLGTLQEKNDACRSFFSHLNESLSVWGRRIPVDARASYSKMAEELCGLLVSVPAEGSTPSVQMSCFETMLIAPIPEDMRSCHLQDAVSVFTYILSEAAT